MKWITPVVIVTCILFVIFSHFVLPWENVFDPWGVKLNTVDAYYEIRYADMVPNIPEHDYYIGFPEGRPVLQQQGFANLISNVAEMGSMDNKTAGAWLPPILFLLALIPFYFMVRRLFNGKIALIAFAVVCFIPGQLLNRTQLGAADHHALEIFLFTSLMFFVVCAIKDDDRFLKIIDIILACVAFYAYFMSWQGALLAAFIIGLYFTVLFIKEYWPIAIPVSIIALGVGIYFVAFSDWFHYPLQVWQMFAIDPNAVINEEYSLIFTNGRFDITAIWGEYGIGFWIALVGLGIMGFQYWKYQDRGILFFLVLTVVLLGITLARRRFTYYLSFEIAVLIAYAVYYFYLNVFKKRANRVKFAIAMFLILAIPLGRGSVVQAVSTEGYMSTDWTQAVNYLRGISEKQENDRFVIEFGGNKIFNSLSRLEQPTLYNSGQKPPFGVLSWWDNGYWILAEAHMPVICTPGNGDRTTAALLLASTQKDILFPLGFHGLKYIVISRDMVTRQAYNICQTAMYNGPIEKTLMYRLFTGVEVPGIRKIMESSNHEVMIFEAR